MNAINIITRTVNDARKLVTTMVGVLTLGLLTMGCPEPGPTTYTVTLDANGGIAGTTTTITVAHGGTVPSNTTGLPTREGYTLAGWNTKADGTGTAFVFGTTPVTANITLYAKWTINYTVTFNSNQGSTIESQNVAQGSKATAPSPPTRDGYTFAGWFKDNMTFVNAFNFAIETIIADITLYAKWNGPFSYFTSSATFYPGPLASAVNSVAPTYTGTAGSYSITSTAVTNISINQTTGIITWTGVIPAGTYNIGVSNSNGGAATFTLTVNTTAVLNGKTYKIVTIGTQCWLAENLNDAGNTSGTSSYYNDDATNGATYGRLYDWDAAIDIDSKINGWHLPTDAEWTWLSGYLGGESVAGDKMKVGGGSGFNAKLTHCG